MTQSPALPLPPPDERRRLREAASLTRAQLASRVGVTSETVRGWETGRSTPRGRKGRRYARLLKSLGAGKELTTSHIFAAGADGPARRRRGWVRARAVGPRRYGDAADALTPDQAFDALYSFCAPALVRQTYLLTGRRELARESVERAFHIAWQRWPEVARDRDPAGWVRAVAYDCALSPWHRFRLRHRHPEPPPPDAFDRALMDTLLRLPPSYRRTLLLYDGVGLGLPETAAETEASTRAATNRLVHAREAVAERLPELADPEVLHWRLVELASIERLRAAKPLVVRRSGERRARLWTRAAIAFTVALIGTTVLTVRTAPARYEPPVPAGETVQGVPPRVAPGPLSEKEQKLRKKLRKEQQRGPDRLLPQPS
ncbi:helix-turn-helix domain-containing protein [Streptomyces viridochromogenes]|uniref:helix-turn-helix domain-containing protein n=1 Tax=Streptomyces viridochromogenes TaxID=1938 RepID=UPI0001B4B5B0|nr:helix-turn-helix domain-containing protein [Streptomyces viridochromogenes]